MPHIDPFASDGPRDYWPLTLCVPTREPLLIVSCPSLQERHDDPALKSVEWNRRLHSGTALAIDFALRRWLGSNIYHTQMPRRLVAGHRHFFPSKRLSGLACSCAFMAASCRTCSLYLLHMAGDFQP